MVMLGFGVNPLYRSLFPGNKVLIEVRSFKIIEVPTDPPYPSSIDVLENPPLSTVVQFWYEY